MDDEPEGQLFGVITPAQAGKALNLLIASKVSTQARRIASLLMQEEKFDRAIEILRLNDYCGQCVLALLNGELTRGQKMSFRYTLLCLLGDKSTEKSEDHSDGVEDAQNTTLSELSIRIKEIHRDDEWFMEEHIDDFAKHVSAYLDAFLVRYPADGKETGDTSLSESEGDGWKKEVLVALEDDDVDPPKMVRGYDLNVLVHIINMLEAHVAFLNDLITDKHMEIIRDQKEKIWPKVLKVLEKMKEIQSRLYDYSGHDYFDDLMTNLSTMLVESSKIKRYLYYLK